MIEFTLTPDDVAFAKEIAADWARQATAKKAFNGKYGNTEGRPSLDVPSAIAQYACSLTLNRAWIALIYPLMPGTGLPQVDGCVVKSTFHRFGGLLIDCVDEMQPLDVPWVLVIHDRHREGRGWIAGYQIPANVQLERYVRRDFRSPAALIPCRQLLPPEELIQ